jgi:hypothetical protein
MNCAEQIGAITFKTIDAPFPGATEVLGISGNLVVGYDNNAEGFVYNGTSFTYYRDPLAATTGNFASYGTVAYGVSGNKVVGGYYDTNGIVHGFVFDGSTYKTLDDPSANKTTIFQGTLALGFSGNKIFGQYNNPGGFGAFFYDGTSFSDFTHPAAGFGRTHVTGAFGNEIVGYYSPDGITDHGFLYNGSSFKTLDDPLAVAAPFGMGQTYLTGISGGYIVGYYTTDDGNTRHGLVYNGSTFMTVDDPLANGDTRINGIDGNVIVGTYNRVGDHGFIAQLPEPSTLALSVFAGFGFIWAVVAQKRRASIQRRRLGSIGG